MESTDSSAGSQQPNLPPGFRFHPTDEELVVHYLKKKTTSSPLPVAIIAEVDLYKFDPWELPAKATFGEQEWYFFSPRDRKYPNGARPNRAATSGYWKATGTDKPVLTSGGTQKVGVKKALVFYGGKPPKGIKTNWIMHEYRLADNKVNTKPPGCDIGNKKNSLRLDDWVLCRIYKKNNNTNRFVDHDRDESMENMLATIPPSITVGGHQQQHNHPRIFHHLPTTKASNYGALLENNDHHHSSLFEGLINGNEGIINNNPSPSSIVQAATTTTTTSNPFSSMKRSLPCNLFWNDEDELVGQSSNKRVVPEQEDANDHQHGNNNSIVPLLSQLPQTPSLPHQTMLGSFGDGAFRQSYQLPGLNWYS